MSRRHPALVPVARDHVLALSIAARLRRGPRDARDRWPAAPADQADELQRFLETALRPHFALEEALVFPAAVRHVPAAAALVARLVEEHREIERMILALAGTVPDMPTLAALGSLLESHVRREDRALFPMMEAQVPAAALSALAGQVAAADAQACADGDPAVTP